jgi:serine/threonine protein kinase
MWNVSLHGTRFVSGTHLSILPSALAIVLTQLDGTHYAGSQWIFTAAPQFKLAQLMLPHHAEQVGEDEVTSKADVWALAATLLQCWTGELPHGNLHDMQIGRRLDRGIAPSLECTTRPLPEDIAALLRPCFSIDAAQRPTAVSLLHQLAQLRTTLSNNVRC